MVIYRLESTSTTSCTSEGNSYDCSDKAHIGHIDEALPLPNCQPENSTDVDIISVLSGGSAASKASDASNEVSASSSLDIISYDSSMDRIRKDVWGKVREAKRKRQQAKNAMKEKFDSEFEVNPSSSSQEKGTASNHAQRKAGFVLVNGPDDLGSFGDHLAAEQVACSHSRNLPRPILDSFERQPLRDTDDSLDGKAIWMEHADQRLFVIEEHIPGYDTNSEPSAGQVVREKGIAEVTKNMKDFQDEEIDSVFASILAIQLDETKPVSRDERTSSLDSQSHPTQSTSEPVVRAEVFGARENTILCVPLFLVEKRENEMFELAYKLGIRPDEWNGSLLSRKLQTLYPYRAKHPQSVFTFELYPESEFAVSNCSQDFRWEPWINQSIESFYKTGRMRVPDFCVGSDLLTALEYFGILYDADALVFDSFSTFLRVKLWSEYFSHRDAITTWIMGRLTESNASTRVFSTCPRVINKGSFIAVSTRQAELFDGGISLDPKQHSETQSSVLVYRFFNVSENETCAKTTIDSLTREDFCKYLRRVVPGTNASFPKKLVTIHHADETREELELATLYIQLEDPALLQADDSSTSHDVESELLSGLSDSHGPSYPTLPVCRFLDTLAFPQFHFSDAKPLLDPPCNVSYEIKTLCEELKVPTPIQCHPVMADYHPTDPLLNQRSNAELLVDPPSNISYAIKAKCDDLEVPVKAHFCTTDPQPTHSNAKLLAEPSSTISSFDTTDLREDLELPRPRQCHHAPDPPASGQFDFPTSPKDVTQSHQAIDAYNLETRKNNKILDCHDSSLGPTLPACNLSAYVESKSSEESIVDQSAQLPSGDKACEGNDLFREERFPAGDFWTAKWKPVVSPDCVSESPNIQLEESDIADIWMPWNLAEGGKEATPSLFMAARSNGRIQHLRPLPSGTSGSQSVTAQESASTAFNHIYEDLMLQDTDFFVDGWEKPTSEATKTVPRDFSVGTAATKKCREVMLDKYDDRKKLQRVHFHVHNKILRYDPNDFVRDVASLFDFADDGYSDDTNDLIEESSQLAARQRTNTGHDPLHRPPRPDQKQNREAGPCNSLQQGDRRLHSLESMDKNKRKQFIDPSKQNVLQQPTGGNHSLTSQHKQRVQFVVPGKRTLLQDHTRGIPSLSFQRTNTIASILDNCSETSSAMASSVFDVSMTTTTWEPSIDFPDDESPL